MLLSDIDTWSVGALQSIAHELGGELTTIEGVASDLDLISRLPGWDSPAADAARGKIHETTGKVLDDAAVIGAVQQLASETAGAVSKLQTELESIRSAVAAQGGFLVMADNGDITVTGPPDVREELKALAEDLETRAKALIHQAEDIDADCAEVFGHIENGDITARGATDAPSAEQMGRDQSGLSAPYPPEGDGAKPRGGTRYRKRNKTRSRPNIQIGSVIAQACPARSEARSTRRSSTANWPTRNVRSTRSRPFRSMPAQEPAAQDPPVSAVSTTGWWPTGTLG